MRASQHAIVFSPHHISSFTLTRIRDWSHIFNSRFSCIKVRKWSSVFFAVVHTDFCAKHILEETANELRILSKVTKRRWSESFSNRRGVTYGVRNRIFELEIFALENRSFIFRSAVHSGSESKAMVLQPRWCYLMGEWKLRSALWLYGKMFDAREIITNIAFYNESEWAAFSHSLSATLDLAAVNCFFSSLMRTSW